MGQLRLQRFRRDGLPDRCDQPVGRVLERHELDDRRTYTAAGQLPPTLAEASYPNVRGVRYTWTGTFAPTGSGSNPFTAVFSVKLKDSAAAANNIRNCAEMSYDDTGTLINKQTYTACDSINITGRAYSVNQAKAFSPGAGTIGMTPAATTTATLTVTNTSNVGIGSIVVTDPASGSSPFDRWTSPASPLTMPNNVRLAIEVDQEPACAGAAEPRTATP